jgi:hypothetical protein
MVYILKHTKIFIYFIPISKIKNLYIRCILDIKRKNIKIYFDSKMARL